MQMILGLRDLLDDESRVWNIEIEELLGEVSNDAERIF